MCAVKKGKRASDADPFLMLRDVLIVVGLCASCNASHAVNRARHHVSSRAYQHAVNYAGRTGAVFGRRQHVAWSAAALLSIAGPSIDLAAAAAIGRAEPSPTAREAAIESLLGRMPGYVITNSLGTPYLTNADDSGRRYGSIFIGPEDALPLLDSVRQFDQDATLAVLPLSTVYEPVYAASTVRRSRETAPQPMGSTSTDLNLFQLVPPGDEQRNAAAVSLLPGAAMQPGVLLFYEPTLFLGADAASRQRPYFFRLSDLNATWRRGNGDARNEGRISPSLRVVTLEGLLRQVANGELEVPPILMPPSETASLEYRSPAD